LRTNSESQQSVTAFVGKASDLVMIVGIAWSVVPMVGR